MAKKPASRTIKRPAIASSSKTMKSSGKSSIKTPQKSSGKAITKKKVPVKAKSKSRVSYKQEYIKLLQKTNKTLTKDIKAIRKAIEQPEYRGPEAFPREAFPKEEPVQLPPSPKIKPQSIEEQILSALQDLELQVRSRDMAFDDLVSGDAKFGGFQD